MQEADIERLATLLFVTDKLLKKLMLAILKSPYPRFISNRFLTRPSRTAPLTIVNTCRKVTSPSM